MATCLIGEADPFLARLLQRFGEASGLTVVRAKVGQELLALARELHPDVVIVEAELPGTLRGWQAVQALKADEAMSEIPVVACSWLRAPEVRALAGDIVAHLQKPDLHYEDFVAALASAGVKVPNRPAHGGDGGPA